MSVRSKSFIGRRWTKRALLMGLVFGVAGMTQISSPAQEPQVDVEIVAHRGASADAPENTLASMNLAWEQQADAVEFDVWMTADGQIVLHHDADTKRTAGVDRRIDQQTWEELQQLEVGSWKNERFAGERIPLLSQALATIPEGKRVFIEVKCGPEIVSELQRVIDDAALPIERTAIISFSDRVCAECKAAMPELEVYWIVGLKKDETTGEWNHTAQELIARAKELKLDGLDLQAAPMVDSALVRQAIASGLEVYVWTVNDEQVARAMLEAGVAGITTDKPLWLRERLHDSSQ